MNEFVWLLRREVWEHRGLYLVPLALAGVLALVYALAWFAPGINLHIDIGGVTVGELKRSFLVDPAYRHELQFGMGALPFIVPTVLITLVTIFLWFFYLTGSLYGERRDRSVLFWKSMPVSDSATVLSKFVTALLVMPALAIGAIVGAALLMTLINTVVVTLFGGNAWSIVLSEVPFFSGTLLVAYQFLAHALWYAPVFAYLLLASAFAPRAPALWAVVPPLALVVLERLMFGTYGIATFLAARLPPNAPASLHEPDFGGALRADGEFEGQIDWFELVAPLVDPLPLLSEPGLWGGFVAAGVMVAGAIWLRRYRDAF